MAHQVFLCHSSNDKVVADAACAALEARHFGCWIAPRNVLPGVEYGSAIIDALSGCEIVVLIFSQHSNDSPQVRREIERAVSKNKILLPFRIDDVMPSHAMEYALGNTHWLDAQTPPMEARLEQLCTAVADLMAGQPAMQKTAPQTQPVSTPMLVGPLIPAGRGSISRWVWGLVSAGLVIVSLATVYQFRFRQTPPPRGKKTVVLADFANSTGDAAFDDILRQGTEVQLEQSPFLSPISDNSIQQVLSLMGKPAGTPLTAEIAREVCARTDSVAVFEGSIANLGSQYVLSLRATDCARKVVLSREQAQAARKEDVLNALDQIASNSRKRVDGFQRQLAR